MSSPKNRDLAQELVDFLMKEEGKKSSPEEGHDNQSPAIGGDKKTKTKAIEATVNKTKTMTSGQPTTEQKTFALQPESPAPKITNQVPPIPGVVSPPAIEFDLDLGDGAPPEVDFSHSNRKVEEALARPTPEKLLENEKTKKRPPQHLQEEVKPKIVPEAGSPHKRPATSSEAVPKTEFKFGQTTLPQSQNKSGVDGFGASQRGRTIFSEVNNLLGGVEAVRVAQARITALETERDQLRNETDKLLATCESLKSRIDEVRAEQEKQDRKHREKIEILEEEKVVAKSRLTAREEELGVLKREHDDYKSRFQGDLRKIRVRERDLESRQELLKAESSAIIKSKDEMILELKRQLEQLTFEINNFRAQSADLHATINEFYERNNRTVKALRLALSILEIGDQEDRVKKAAG